MHRRRFDARPMGTISMSVQEYLSTSPPQDALRWMGMRRALVVIAATGRMLDGTNVVFSVPSGDVKAVTPFQIRSGAATRLTVDVDLARSIVANGSGWTFTPVIGQIRAA